MAEYITKEQVIENVIGQGNLFLVNELENLPNADVVERSEYEFIRHQLVETMDRVAELDKINTELRSKIDKAIEEINHLTIYHKTTQGSELVSRKAVLRTINKYLGE